MHKRAQEHMVSTRGGIRQLHPELQDELLKFVILQANLPINTDNIVRSEFFLPLLLYGSFACEVTEDDVLVRFKEHVPAEFLPGSHIPSLFLTIFAKGLFISPTLKILQRIFSELSPDPGSVIKPKKTIKSTTSEGVSSLSVSTRPIYMTTEMGRVLQLTEQVQPKSRSHQIVLALLIYIFNLHNQAYPSTLAPAVKTSSDAPQYSGKTYLDILTEVALEMTNPGNPENPNRVTEREVTLWTMVAIGSAASFSPWRLEIPFMGHMIVLMENDAEQVRQSYHASPISATPGSQYSVSTPGHSKERSNLSMLTEYLRGYYLYGADKDHLDSLQRWKG